MAGGIPIAVGAALAIKKQKRDDVALCFFGDGASNEGAFYEALNMAAPAKLAVAETTSSAGAIPGTNAAAGYSFPGATTYVASITIGANGVITATPRNTGAGTNPVITMTPTQIGTTGQLTWKCTTVAGATKYVPASCR